jgi:hypothetical protein
MNQYLDAAIKAARAAGALVRENFGRPLKVKCSPKTGQVAKVESRPENEPEKSWSKTKTTA